MNPPSNGRSLANCSDGIKLNLHIILDVISVSRDLRNFRILDILFWLFCVIEIPADAHGAGELRFCMFVIGGLQDRCSVIADVRYDHD